MLTAPSTGRPGPLPAWAMGLLWVLTGGLAAGRMTGFSEVWFLGTACWLTEAAVALVVAVSAGGYGGLVVGRLAPRPGPRGLVAVTACGLGLWMLSTGVLLAGSAAGGLLTGRVWWPVVGAGVALAAWQVRRAVGGWRPGRGVRVNSLVWLLAAAAVGMWIAGAARPPGFVGTHSGDAYDVLEYHLQVPREYLQAGRIGPLRHNCYSFYPLGVEMLTLLGMCLRGGAYEGMYLATVLHGLFGVLATVAVATGLGGGLADPQRDVADSDPPDPRARAAAILLATAPGVICLSWLAMSELAEVFYTALALLWLRAWLRERRWRTAAIIGLVLGAACAAKYLSVGLVAAPVLAAMLAGSVRSARRLAQTALAAAVAMLPVAPWLVRNAAYTGNPVFPLATSVFGRGHWSAESQRRWQDGHAPDSRPPVPPPPDWRRPDRPGRPATFISQLVRSYWFGPLLPVLALLGLAVALARRRADRWDWALGGVWVAQLVVWATFTRDMPPRFLAPAIVPMALLAGGLLKRTPELRAAALREAGRKPEPARIGRALAGFLFAVAAGLNLFASYGLYCRDTGGQPVAPWPGQTIAAEVPPYRQAHELGPHARLMLVGEATAFYFPPRTVYATVFDDHPLARWLGEGLSPRQVLGELRRLGVTHVRVHWGEIWRLSNTYGFPAPLSAELHRRRSDGRPVGLEIIDRLVELGAAPLPQASTQDRATVYALPP